MDASPAARRELTAKAAAPAGSDPLGLFREWHDVARAGERLNHPGAACLSTTDSLGQPAARFVDLKEVSETGFVFCTSLESPKARDLVANSAAALTFWWDHVERQVRVTGQAERISDANADRFFHARPRAAQITSWAARQSDVLQDPRELEERFSEVERRFANGVVPRPEHWGGFCIIPARIEFLTFQSDRRHDRIVFEKVGDAWRRYRPQP